jgi:transposase InsO family protein
VEFPEFAINTFICAEPEWRKPIGVRLNGDYSKTPIASRIRMVRVACSPEGPFCDNGSDFTSQIMDLVGVSQQVRIDFSRPGKPTDNAYVESFNGTKGVRLSNRFEGRLARLNNGESLIIPGLKMGGQVTVSTAATNHLGHLANPLVLGVVPAFRPPAVMTFRGHCRNVGTNLQPAPRPYSRNSVICRCYVFGELNA